MIPRLVDWRSSSACGRIFFCVFLLAIQPLSISTTITTIVTHHIMQTFGVAVDGPKDKFHLFEFKRREVGEKDILIQIQFAGICHSDIHTAREEWGKAKFPLVPGHEIVGKVVKVGSGVTKFKVGDHAGVGCFVDSCGHCENCTGHEEQFCATGASMTYNSTEQDKTTPTYGGYSNQIVIKEHYALKISEKFKSLDAVAPLLCAGITTYSPLVAWKDKVVGKKIGVVGLGGLGHMAIKIAAAMGAEVTVFSTSESKKADAQRLGAKHFVNTKNEAEVKAVAKSLTYILNTVSAHHDMVPYLSCLKPHGALIYVGAPPEPLALPVFPILIGNKIIAGSNIGGIKETQEMLDFCAEKGIVSDIELISVDKIDVAYDRTVASDVKYRFVIDISTLKTN